MANTRYQQLGRDCKKRAKKGGHEKLREQPRALIKWMCCEEECAAAEKAAAERKEWEEEKNQSTQDARTDMLVSERIQYCLQISQG
jgi:hypothetical protein